MPVVRVSAHPDCLHAAFPHVLDSALHPVNMPQRLLLKISVKQREKERGRGRERDRERGGEEGRDRIECLESPPLTHLYF